MDVVGFEDILEYLDGDGSGPSFADMDQVDLEELLSVDPPAWADSLNIPFVPDEQSGSEIDWTIACLAELDRRQEAEKEGLTNYAPVAAETPMSQRPSTSKIESQRRSDSISPNNTSTPDSAAISTSARNSVDQPEEALNSTLSVAQSQTEGDGTEEEATNDGEGETMKSPLATRKSSLTEHDRSSMLWDLINTPPSPVKNRNESEEVQAATSSPLTITLSDSPPPQHMQQLQPTQPQESGRMLPPRVPAARPEFTTHQQAVACQQQPLSSDRRINEKLSNYFQIGNTESHQPMAVLRQVEIPKPPKRKRKAEKKTTAGDDRYYIPRSGGATNEMAKRRGTTSTFMMIGGESNEYADMRSQPGPHYGPNFYVDTRVPSYSGGPQYAGHPSMHGLQPQQVLQQQLAQQPHHPNGATINQSYEDTRGIPLHQYISQQAIPITQTHNHFYSAQPQHLLQQSGLAAQHAPLTPLEQQSAHLNPSPQQAAASPAAATEATPTKVFIRSAESTPEPEERRPQLPRPHHEEEVARLALNRARIELTKIPGLPCYDPKTGHYPTVRYDHRKSYGLVNELIAKAGEVLHNQEEPPVQQMVYDYEPFERRRFPKGFTIHKRSHDDDDDIEEGGIIECFLPSMTTADVREKKRSTKRSRFNPNRPSTSQAVFDISDDEEEIGAAESTTFLNERPPSNFASTPFEISPGMLRYESSDLQTPQNIFDNEEEDEIDKN